MLLKISNKYYKIAFIRIFLLTKFRIILTFLITKKSQLFWLFGYQNARIIVTFITKKSE